jgi:hypothetical protein
LPAQGASGAGSGGGADALPADLLALFMQAGGPDGQPLTREQLADTVINFVMAGRDTTAQVHAGSGARSTWCVVACLRAGHGGYAPTTRALTD